MIQSKICIFLVNKTKNKKQTNYYQNILSIFEIGNEIGDEGMKHLSESFKSNNSIQTLGLESK